MFHLKNFLYLSVLYCINDVLGYNGEGNSTDGAVGCPVVQGCGVTGASVVNETSEVTTTVSAATEANASSVVNATVVAPAAGDKHPEEIEFGKLEPFVKEHITDKSLFPLEIKGLPEKEGDLLEYVRNYLDKIGVLGVDEVKHAYRVAKKFQNIVGPRAIVAAVSSVKIRDEIIRKGNANRQVTSADFEAAQQAQPERIYVNEFMNRDTKQLVYETKRFGRSIGYNRLWVRDGVIYLGNNMGGRVISVANFDELDELIETAQHN